MKKFSADRKSSFYLFNQEKWRKLVVKLGLEDIFPFLEKHSNPTFLLIKYLKVSTLTRISSSSSTPRSVLKPDSPPHQETQSYPTQPSCESSTSRLALQPSPPSHQVPQGQHSNPTLLLINYLKVCTPTQPSSSLSSTSRFAI